MNKEWLLTQENFDRLLDWLNADRDRAAEKYEAIRLRLIKIFTCRGCADAEELSDETISRVAAKIGTIAGTSQGDPALYFYGVAQKVHLEYLRESRTVWMPEHSASVNQQVTDALANDIEAEYQCLERCLEHLPAANRDLVLRYYQQEKQAKVEHRKELATELGIAVNALRIRAHRIRVALMECIQDCLKEPM